MASPLPTRPGKRRLNAEINVVPYIDVMLVLLIIFMVTAPLLTQGVEVDLPTASADNVSVAAEPITLFVDAKGSFRLQIGSSDAERVDDADLVGRVATSLGAQPDATVLLRADRRVDYGRVAQGMALLQKAGARKLGFVTEQAEQ